MTELKIDAPNRTQDLVDLESEFGAHNYNPLNVVLVRAEGVWVYDVEGRRYLDCLAAYSAVNQGHCHPEILRTLQEQAEKITLTSRAFRNEQLPLFCKELHELTGFDMVLPMNSGVEAMRDRDQSRAQVGLRGQGNSQDKAEIIVCAGTSTGAPSPLLASQATTYRQWFWPFTPGFTIIPYGNIQALRDAITPNACGFLVEPIQSEAGIVIPPTGYLREAAEICKQNNVLLMADRDSVRPWPHRQALRLHARGRHPGCLNRGQSPCRRVLSGFSGPCFSRDIGPLPAR